LATTPSRPFSLTALNKPGPSAKIPPGGVALARINNLAGGNSAVQGVRVLNPAIHLEKIKNHIDRRQFPDNT
jgi:hypothetical protein